MRVIGQKNPKGLKPAEYNPHKRYTPINHLIGRDVELYLQSEHYQRDEAYLCRVQYVTALWVGVVSAYRSRVFYDHVPTLAIRRIRGDIPFKEQQRISENLYQAVDFDAPKKIVDLVGEEVIIKLQGNTELADHSFKTRLVYVKKRWLGVSSMFNGVVVGDHIPLTSVRKVSIVQLTGQFLSRGYQNNTSTRRGSYG